MECRVPRHAKATRGVRWRLLECVYFYGGEEEAVAAGRQIEMGHLARAMM